MSVKSTQTVTRDEAIDLAISFRNQIFGRRREQVWPYYLTDTQLEDILTVMDDDLADGESFRNYMIKGNW